MVGKDADVRLDIWTYAGSVIHRRFPAEVEVLIGIGKRAFGLLFL